ncbi:MAG: DegT/DnrJ/EryC1/StrS family aminotransferase [Bacteroidia bacterium]|nr:DegT/DnrJ/EryC1/StrS family aminotransferase [Bacteroidia bacterium]MDW8089605.1 DegT/DnrJ/EryC1/StrS family aminotransferase [Bacteroidia bacterium]
MRIPFHKPYFSEAERRYLLAALEEGYWGGGRWVAHLEAYLKSLYGREVVLVSSGTAALHLALALLLGDKGGEVIVPTWTFTATAAAVVHAGGSPVLADVGPSLHLTAETVEAVRTPRTRGVVVVHYAGVPAPMEELMTLCERHGWWLVEDACHALPAWYAGKLCGTFGSAAVLSFHATKPIAAGQGGALLLESAELAQRARLLRRNGLYRPLDAPWDYTVEALGWNYMPSDFQAAVALAQAERLLAVRAQRRHLAEAYAQQLKGEELIQLYPFHEPSSSAYHLLPAFIQGLRVESRKALFHWMREEGVELALHYKPLHLQPAYRAFWRPGQSFPQAEAIWPTIFSLPLWPGLSTEAVEFVTSRLKAWVRQAPL